MRCVIDKRLKTKPKKKGQNHRKRVEYLQTPSRAPQAASWWRSGPRCRLCGRHTPWPAGTPLWTWSLWNWTQSDTDIEVTLTQKKKWERRTKPDRVPAHFTPPNGFFYIFIVWWVFRLTCFGILFQQGTARQKWKFSHYLLTDEDGKLGNFTIHKTLFTPLSFRQLVSEWFKLTSYSEEFICDPRLIETWITTLWALFLLGFFFFVIKQVFSYFNSTLFYCAAPEMFCWLSISMEEKRWWLTFHFPLTSNSKTFWIKFGAVKCQTESN